MTDVEPQHRRSRIGWTLRTEPTTTPAGTHDHGQNNGPLALAFICIVLLVALNVVLFGYILARGEERDAENERVQEQIRDSWCQALDAFPEGNPWLDPLRDQYGCGPGRPLEDLTPEQRQQIQSRTTRPTVAQSVLPPAPPRPSGDLPGAIPPTCAAIGLCPKEIP